MEKIRLLRLAERGNITVDFAPLTRNKAFCITLGGKKYIAVDKSIPPESSEERVVLAHELGHLKTDSLYGKEDTPLTCRRAERRADVWAIRSLVPLSRLREAIRRGDESVSELAERFSVTEEFMQKAIKYYCEQKSVG